MLHLQTQSQCTSLLLSNNQLSSTALLLLAPHVAAHATLEELDLSSNKFSDSGFVALCQALVDTSPPPPLAHLSVAGNALSARGTQALAEWLVVTRLHSLDVARVCASRSSALEPVLRALAPATLAAPSCLARLDVSGNRLTDAQAPLLAAAWRAASRSLRVVSAAENAFSSSGVSTLSAALSRMFESPEFRCDRGRSLSTSLIANRVCGAYFDRFITMFFWRFGCQCDCECVEIAWRRALAQVCMISGISSCSR